MEARPLVTVAKWAADERLAPHTHTRVTDVLRALHRRVQADRASLAAACAAAQAALRELKQAGGA